MIINVIKSWTDFYSHKHLYKKLCSSCHPSIHPKNYCQNEAKTHENQRNLLEIYNYQCHQVTNMYVSSSVYPSIGWKMKLKENWHNQVTSVHHWPTWPCLLLGSCFQWASLLYYLIKEFLSFTWCWMILMLKYWAHPKTQLLDNRGDRLTKHRIQVINKAK